MSWWWILLLILVWLACCGLAAWVAGEKGRSGLNWFILAFLLSPLAALIALAGLKSAEDRDRERAARIGLEGSFRACPACREAVREHATRCPHCRTELTLEHR